MAGKRLSPAAVLVGAAAAVAASAVLVAFFASARKRSAFELCRNNLLHISMAMRSGELFDSPRWDDVPCGRAFLSARERWPTRQRFEIDLSCPVKGEGREIDYRGPARPLRRIGADEPVCADRPGNHGPGAGGNVLRKSGDIAAAGENDPLWSMAAQTTSD